MDGRTREAKQDQLAQAILDFLNRYPDSSAREIAANMLELGIQTKGLTTRRIVQVINSSLRNQITRRQDSGSGLRLYSLL